MWVLLGVCFVSVISFALGYKKCSLDSSKSHEEKMRHDARMARNKIESALNWRTFDFLRPAPELNILVESNTLSKDIFGFPNISGKAVKFDPTRGFLVEIPDDLPRWVPLLLLRKVKNNERKKIA